jgi:hypothetical protein
MGGGYHGFQWQEHLFVSRRDSRSLDNYLQFRKSLMR